MACVAHRIGHFVSRFGRLSSVGPRLYHSRSQGEVDGNTQVIDLRSDVLTQPTPAIRQALAEGTAKDDVFNEDPTVLALQDRAAELFGMEAALFVPSGTMGNLISVLCHCNARGLEALFGHMSHLIRYEQGGTAILGGIMPRTLPNLPDGTFDIDLIESYVRPYDDPHQPWTSLICVENTHNDCGGKVLPLSWLARLRKEADRFNLPVHMDGARAMNAAVSCNVPIKDILTHVNSVSVCMSKAIGAPVGSIIGGSAELVAQAVRFRKILGGGWRQPGPLANAVMVALDDAVPRIQEDHRNAQYIAKEITENGSGVVSVDLPGVHSNIIMISTLNGLTAKTFCDRLQTVTDDEAAELGERVIVKSMPFYKYVARIVAYSSVQRPEYELAARKIKYVARELASQASQGQKEKVTA